MLRLLRACDHDPEIESTRDIGVDRIGIREVLKLTTEERLRTMYPMPINVINAAERPGN